MSNTTYVHGTHAAEQARLARLNEMTNESFIDFLRPQNGEQIIEIGCGLGILTETVARRFPQVRLCGLEYSSEQLARTHKGLTNLCFIRGDAHQVPAGSDVFDLAYCRYVLEHVADADRVVREMYRLLTSGGRACVQENNALVSVFDPDCPGFDFLWREYVALQAEFGGDPRVGKKLYSLFLAAGFRDIQLSYEPEIHHAGQPSFKPWVENLIGIVEACAADLLKRKMVTQDDLRDGIAEARVFTTRQDATALFYWNRATGVK